MTNKLPEENYNRLQIQEELLNLSKKKELLEKEREKIIEKEKIIEDNFWSKVYSTNDLDFLREILKKKDNHGHYKYKMVSLFSNPNINEEIAIFILETRAICPVDIDCVLSSSIINSKLIRKFLDKIDFKREVLLKIPKVRNLSDEEKMLIINDYSKDFLDVYLYK